MSKEAETDINYLIENVKEWAWKRNIYNKGDSKTQLIKLMEEVGELSRAIIKDDIDLTTDSIGDIMVVLVNLTEIINLEKMEETGSELTLAFCMSEAYNEIKDRKGSMKNGSFAKE